jgi:hypothetical protein
MRGGESVVYAGIESITIPPECQTDPVSPPGPGPTPGPPGPTPGPPGPTPGPPGQPPPPSAIPAATPGADPAATLGAIIVAATRNAGIVRLEATASFLVRAGTVLDPAAWRWRIRALRRLPAGLEGPVMVVKTRRLLRSWLEVHGATGPLGHAALRLPVPVRRLFTVRVPEPTLASDALRAAVPLRAASVATRRELKVLPRALRAGWRVLSVVKPDGQALAVRIRVKRPKSNRWLKRLERLPADRLQQAVGGRPIILARGATLRIVRVRGVSRLSLTFRTQAPAR